MKDALNFWNSRFLLVLVNIKRLENYQLLSDEDTAVRVAAETAGGLMLHNYLLTMNVPPLQDPKGARFY